MKEDGEEEEWTPAGSRAGGGGRKAGEGGRRAGETMTRTKRRAGGTEGRDGGKKGGGEEVVLRLKGEVVPRKMSLRFLGVPLTGTLSMTPFGEERATVGEKALNGLKTHQSPITRLSTTFSPFHPHTIETIDPLLTAEPGTANLNVPTVSVASTRELAIVEHEKVLEREGEEAIILYSDGSLLEGRAGASVVWRRRKGEAEEGEGEWVFPAKGMALGQSQSVYVAELVGVRSAINSLALMLPSYPSNTPLPAHLFLDNQSAVLNSCSSDATPGQSLRLDIHQRYRNLKLAHPNLQLTLHWIPGHEGVEGNEAADEAAKAAALTAETLSHFLLSCPLYRAQRADLAKAVGPQYRNLPLLLSDPTVVPHTLDFVLATGRFSRYHLRWSATEEAKRRKERRKAKKGNKGREKGRSKARG